MNRSHSLAEWRSRQLHALTLPTSGLAVRVKRVTLDSLAARGHVPTPLHAQVEAMINAGTAAAAPAPTALTLDAFVASASVIDLVARAVLVDPPVADEPDDTHLAIHELPFDDRVYLFNWAHEGVAQIAPFPEPTGSSPRPARGRQRLRSATEPAASGELGEL